MRNGVAYGSTNGASSLSQLNDTVINTPSDGQVLAYDYSTSKWKNQNPSSGGHTMLPTPSASVTENAVVSAIQTGLLEGGANDDVASLYGVGKWSNCEAKVILTTVAKGATGIGDWNDTWKTDDDRTGWLWSEYLYHVIDDGATPTPNINYNVELIPVCDVSQGETVGIASYRIDDDVTHNGVHGGAIAFKFTGSVQSTNGIKVGVKLIFQRTEVNAAGTILTS